MAVSVVTKSKSRTKTHSSRRLNYIFTKKAVAGLRQVVRRANKFQQLKTTPQTSLVMTIHI